MILILDVMVVRFRESAHVYPSLTHRIFGNRASTASSTGGHHSKVHTHHEQVLAYRERYGME